MPFHRHKKTTVGSSPTVVFIYPHILLTQKSGKNFFVVVDFSDTSVVTDTL